MDNTRDVIIMVDDDITNLNVARNNLADKYTIFTAPSGEKLFLLLKRLSPSLILLDIEMPEMDGYQVMAKLKEDEATAHIPVIFLTAKIDPESEVEGLGMGAVDYITKPFSRELLIKRIDLHILIEKQKKDLQTDNLSLVNEVDKKSRAIFELQGAILKTVAELVECRDNITGGHIERTQHYLRLLVDFLLEHNIYTEELSTWDIDLLVMSSQLHDVGKISIKDQILLKPGKLSSDEFDEMKKHTTYGADIIRRIEKSTSENDFLHHAEIMALSHHEKWDGSGYPHGLTENEIPLQGRLMAIADVYDALTDERPYKKKFTHADSVEIIRADRGKHFDPLVTDVFLIHEKEFERDIFSANNNVQTNNLHPTINAVANFMGVRGGKERGHAERMKNYLEVFVEALMKHDDYSSEVSKWDKDLFLTSAQLHDVGEITVADDVLNKTGDLTVDEFEHVKSHIDFGVQIIQQVKDNIGNGSLLHHAEALAGSHHEKWDGTGYPHGLAGQEIPLQGRIMAIVDVYDAMTTKRPHRDRKSHEEAIEFIRNESGVYFDPGLADVFIECEEELVLLVQG